MLQPKDRIAFPLDVSDFDEAEAWVKTLSPHVGVFKVGLQLFTAEGPRVVRMVHDYGSRCFLDLKLHDIPSTVAHAVESAVSLKVKYLTLHTLGGKQMLAEASSIVKGSTTHLLGVTVLTSHDQQSLRQIGFAQEVQSLVIRLVNMGVSAGLVGFVCSPLECKSIRKAIKKNIILVTPGIRRTNDTMGDQTRVATPTFAIQEGADILVVGRPIRNAKNPIHVAQQIVEEIAQVSVEKITSDEATL